MQNTAKKPVHAFIRPGRYPGIWYMFDGAGEVMQEFTDDRRANAACRRFNEVMERKAALELTPVESNPAKAEQEYNQAGFEESWDGR